MSENELEAMAVEPTPEPVVDPQADAALEQSIFENGMDFEGRANVKLYSFTVERGGTTFYFNELKKQQREAALEQSKSIQAEGRRIAKAQKQLNYKRGVAERERVKAIEAGREPGPEVDDSAEEEALTTAGEALAVRSLEFNTWVLESTLVDWANPKWPRKVPCNAETRAQLKPTPRAELSDEVLSRSFSGRGAAAVLAQSS